MQSFKMAIKSATIDSGSLHEKISSFLLAYRNAPHATTNESPAKLFLGRNLRSRLDLIKPNVKDTVEKKQFENVSGYKLPQFNIGDNVMVRDYRENSDKWTNAQVTQKTGPLSYKVQTNGNNNWRRHADQMIKTSVEPKSSEYVPDIPLDINGKDDVQTNDGVQPSQPERRYPLRNRRPPDCLGYS